MSRVRVGMVVVTVAVIVAGWLSSPRLTTVAAVVVTTIAVVAARQRRRRRRVHRQHIGPTVAALRQAVGGAEVRLTVNQAARAALPRLDARRPGRVAVAVRAWWAGTRPGRIVAQVQAATGAVVDPLARRGGPPRITVEVESPYLGDDARAWVHAVIAAKLGTGPLTPTWQLRGPRVVGTWTVRAQPPRSVPVDKVRQALSTLSDGRLYIGEGANGPVTVDIDSDSPHIGLSAGSGAGKSVLAASLAAQVLARGGRVVVIDPKSSSHRWAAGRPDVRYVSTPEKMHHALVKLAELVDRRNAQPDREHRRLLVIVEEVNSAAARLRGWWDDNRPRSGPRISPAIRALEMVSHQGRSARVHLLAAAQQLTARSIGAEARENFAVRALARHSAGTWKMLAPDAPRPLPSRHPGRWHVIIGGQVTEVQVPHVTAAAARSIAGPAMSQVSQVSQDREKPALTSDVACDKPQTYDGPLSLRQAVDQGLIPWSLTAARKRLERATDPPAAAEVRGQTRLYRREDLAAWVERETARRA